MARDVFISHAFADGVDTALLVQSQFEEKHGLSCFVAEKDIPPGAAFGAMLADALAAAGVVLLLLSERALSSPHVAREIVLAAEHRLPIVPVRLTATPLDGNLNYWLAGLNWSNNVGGLDERSCATLAGVIRDVVAAHEKEPSKRRLDKYTIPFEKAAATSADDLLPRDTGTRVSSRTPACIIVLVDCSRSMNRRIGGSQRARREVVTDHVNALFEELVDQSLGDAGYLPYFFVAAVGYGDVGDLDVGSLLQAADEIVSVIDLASNVLRYVSISGEAASPDGTTINQPMDRPIWVEQRPLRRGSTLATAAFRKAQELCERWVAERPEALPPIVLNITDGQYTDGDPTPVIRAIQEIATPHGNALVFNCHVSDAVLPPTFFPNDDAASAFAGDMARLYEQSSPLPAAMLKVARENGHLIDDGARGYVYNAEVTALADFFNVGTLGRVHRA